MAKVEIAVPIRIVLVTPPAGVDFGIQMGKGKDYETISLVRSKSGNVEMEASISVKGDAGEGEPNFTGPVAQGPASGRFVYVDVGTCAGQVGTVWSRRIKIPLAGITWEMIAVVGKGKKVLQATIPGTAKDGGPSCATVRPAEGWVVVR